MILFILFQCEQTLGNSGCNSKKGVCGKDATTAGLQDLQMHYNVGISQWAAAVIEKGGKVPEEAKELLLDSTFATLTNVNFDANRFHVYLRETDKHRNFLKQKAESLGISPASLKGPAQFQYRNDPSFLDLEASIVGVLNRKVRSIDTSISEHHSLEYGIGDLILMCSLL